MGGSIGARSIKWSANRYHRAAITPTHMADAAAQTKKLETQMTAKFEMMLVASKEV